MSSNFSEGGVRLSLPGFSDYIKKLSEAEKVQRRVFDTEYKKLGLSYSQVTAEARKYEQQLKQTSQQQTKFNRILSGAQKISGATGIGGGLIAAGGAAAAGVAIKATIDFSRESAKLAESFRGQLTALDNLSAAYGASSSAIRSAIREAAQGTLAESDILLAANKALQLDVARTSGDFGRLTQAALVLGRSMGIDATQSIDRFTIALGRKSFPILDDFGIKTAQVNEQIAILGQQKFGKAFEDLSAAERDILFVEAALRVADERVEAIGTDILESAGSFDRLSAAGKNFALVVGTAATPAVQEFNDFLAGAIDLGTDVFIDLAGAVAGFNAALSESQFNVGTLFNQFLEGQITFEEFLFGTDEPEPAKTLDELIQIALDARQDFIDQLQDVQGKGPVTEDDVQTARDYAETLEEDTNQLKQLEAALRRAEQLEISFSRAQEDAARKQARQVAKLNRDQFKERQNFLNDQAKEFDDFNKDQAEAVAEAEQELTKARSEAARDRLREQRNLHRQLRQAEDRFNLDRIQSRRRFLVEDERLRSEGDIIGLMRLRQDFGLTEQEQAENFDLQQRQERENNREQEKIAEDRRREQVSELEKELSDLQNSFAQRQAEFLQAQDEEFRQLQEKQAEQTLALRESYLEQEADRRLSQQRQLEDLGRSLSEQEGLTAEGAQAISDRIGEFFGEDGVSDQIFTGFTARQEKRFEDLYANLEEIVKAGQKELEAQAREVPFLPIITKDSGGGESGLPLHLPGFQHGGSFEVGGTGGADSQLVAFRATPGERVTVTPQQQQYRMPIAMPAGGVMDVRMSGGFNITGAEAASQEVIEASIREMTDTVKIALTRRMRH